MTKIFLIVTVNLWYIWLFLVGFQETNEQSFNSLLSTRSHTRWEAGLDSAECLGGEGQVFGGLSPWQQEEHC